ncbi:MAG: PEP-CTERM sorting domain-containing protein [Clostridia bacterium]|nr:PEP-CTERM sorting domain-containing protein [Akkermansia sp.]MBQ7088867.1 PEP-CTERM sorting domain-containing protein [Clostridia bacterium]
MKKTIIALLALAGVAGASEDTVTWTQLTLDNSDIIQTYDKTDGTGTVTKEDIPIDNAKKITIGTDGYGSLSGGSAALGWSESITLNESWKLVFELTDKALGEGDASLFSIKTKINKEIKDNTTQEITSGMTGPVEDAEILKVCEDGSLKLEKKVDGTPVGETSVSGLITANTATAVTLVFLAEEDTNGNDIGGTFYVYVGENGDSGDAVISYNVDERVEFGENYDARLWTNGGAETFSKIALYSGGVVTVPEPATATLSLLALAGLAARRRRR